MVKLTPGDKRLAVELLIVPFYELEVIFLGVVQQAEGIYKITTTVTNKGFLPTYTSKRAQERKIVRPIEARINLPEGGKLIAGKRDQELDQLEGRSNKLYGGWFSSGNVTDNEKRLEWIVRAPKGKQVEVVVKSERAGTIRTTLDLA